MATAHDTNLMAGHHNSSKDLENQMPNVGAGNNTTNSESSHNKVNHGFCWGLWLAIIQRPSLFARFEVPHDMAFTCSYFILKFLLFVVNVFISPFILVLKSITAYLYPCFTGTLTLIWYYIGKKADLFSCLMFTDPEFEPVAESLGNTQVGAAAMCTWTRIPELVGAGDPKRKMYLFEHKINPNDIKQGGLGNCWLLAALSALAEQPHYIRQMFVTNQINPRGRYKIRLYCPVDKKKMIVTIDDFIPVHSKQGAQTVFSHPNGNEGWVLLIEKAFAKYAGSYHNIEGGLMIYALTAFTGCNGSHFDRYNGGWTRSEMRVTRFPREKGTPPRKDQISFNSTNEGIKSDDEMFEMVFKLLKHRCILAAGSVGRDTTITDGRGKEGGIVGGHAYSILKAYKPHLTTEKIRLIQLRNPWGTFEWYDRI